MRGTKDEAGRKDLSDGNSERHHDSLVYRSKSEHPLLYDSLRPSQHHDNEGGEYKSAGNKVKTKNCVDVVYGDRFSHMWRDVIVRDVALGLGFDIVWLNETSNGAEKSERPLYWLPALEMR